MLTAAASYLQTDVNAEQGQEFAVCVNIARGKAKNRVVAAWRDEVFVKSYLIKRCALGHMWKVRDVETWSGPQNLKFGKADAQHGKSAKSRP